MGRLYYFLSVIVIGVLGVVSLKFTADVIMEPVMQAQTPEAKQAAKAAVNTGVFWAVFAFYYALFLIATCLRLANAGMSKMLALLMLIPAVSFFFMIFLFFKAPCEEEEY